MEKLTPEELAYLQSENFETANTALLEKCNTDVNAKYPELTEPIRKLTAKTNAKAFINGIRAKLKSYIAELK